MMYYYCCVIYSASLSIFHIIHLLSIAFVFLAFAISYFYTSLLFADSLYMS
nr:MAG TPA: hypothetical protein [Caudoviricetes sp.]